MKSFKEFLEDYDIFMEMSNVRKKHTNLPVNIWLDDIGANRNTNHNMPRIKFQSDKSDKANEKAIPISISKNPEILINNYSTELNVSEINIIKKFIIINFDLLMDYWNQEIDIKDFLDKVKKV